jgi:tRNA pseudouridine38-40 synthase
MTDSTSEPAAPQGDGGLVRFRLDLAYDGTDFCGWARQRGQRSVQGDVEDALAAVLRLPGPPRLTVAGRTDAGVHASAQVAHVDLPAELPGPAAEPRRLLRGVNGVLRRDVRLLSVAMAPAGFDARFSALHRRYAYRISDAAYGVPPLRRVDTVWHDRRLDVDAMNTAAARLVGLHDFRAFCRRREGATTVRELQQLACTRDGDLITVSVQADAFCHSMVRSLVGGLIAVGDGRRPVEWPERLLSAPARASAITVAPAHGLTLVAVAYPPDERLAGRAEETRSLRAVEGADEAREPAE